ncbi:BQ2448_1878 [Microbotryum intermedium]|uniref:BQ2448_1878 protein n=1 Tax=Microbotryum intermedium TaxID=269621 RepID=A0A238FF43_9BASI|nr:BQ2448_1878 [Microbotryum intermedium]
MYANGASRLVKYKKGAVDLDVKYGLGGKTARDDNHLLPKIQIWVEDPFAPDLRWFAKVKVVKKIMDPTKTEVLKSTLIDTIEFNNSTTRYAPVQKGNTVATLGPSYP